MKNWMTLEECVELFRKKRDDLTAETVCNYLWCRNVMRKRTRSEIGKRWRNRGVKQLYYKLDVQAVYLSYKPRGKRSDFGCATYVRTTPPPEGWYTLREISERLGCTFTRISGLCNKFTVCSHMWTGKRYAELERFRELILWRPRYFVEKHRSQEWADKRLRWQIRKGVSTPKEFKDAFWTAIYAPELKHL